MTTGPHPFPDLRPEAPFAGRLERVAGGEFAGWHRWSGNDPFEDGTGPFFVGRGSDGGIVCAFRPGTTNLNGHGIVHGGSLMTFADYSLFMLASSDGEEVSGVTVAFNCEFVGAAHAGNLLLARGERSGGGRSLVFARGTITCEGRTVLAFSGTIKRMTRS